MFKFFNFWNTRVNWTVIAQKSKIETVLEKGMISAFFIYLDKESVKAMKKWNKNPDDLKKFIKIIEERIDNKDYFDPRNSIFNEFMIPQSVLDQDLNIVKRVVLSEFNEPLFNWN